MSLQAARGITFCLIAYLAALTGPIFLLLPLLPLLLLPPIIKPTIFRRSIDTFIWAWECLLAGLLDHVGCVKTVITGDKIDPKDHCLFLMNHRTRLDWMFFWSCLFKMDAMKHERVILKGELKHVPGPGWSMQFGLFVFIQRKWELDKLILTKTLDHFRDVKNTVQLLLFPEGTDLTPDTKSRSDAFAEKNGLPKYNHVLHPRTTGFTFLAQHMKKNGTLDAIYDITIGYPINIPQNELSLPQGNFPKEVHYHIKRNPIEQIPDSEEGLITWCQERWSEKEERLEQFYAQKSFNEPLIVSPDSGNLFSFLAIISWLVSMFFQFWMLCTFPLVRWYVLIAVAVMVFMDARLGGIDNFQIDVYNKLFKTKRD